MYLGVEGYICLSTNQMQNKKRSQRHFALKHASHSFHPLISPHPITPPTPLKQASCDAAALAPAHYASFLGLLAVQTMALPMIWISTSSKFRRKPCSNTALLSCQLSKMPFSL